MCGRSACGTRPAGRARRTAAARSVWRPPFRCPPSWMDSVADFFRATPPLGGLSRSAGHLKLNVGSSCSGRGDAMHYLFDGFDVDDELFELRYAGAPVPI